MTKEIAFYLLVALGAGVIVNCLRCYINAHTTLVLARAQQVLHGKN